ncbi:MAG: hypothetical protein VYE77_11745 [Planctomycetota bacterium]|nr:hypothetical protein [Planctomycetota bacterium]
MPLFPRSPSQSPESFLSIKLFGAIAMTLFCLPAASQDCTGSLVANGHFTSGLVAGSMPPASVANWSRLTETPQVMTSQGCSAPGCIQMWGNLVVGESIQQSLPGSGIVAGRTYQVSLRYRWLDNNPNLPPYVRFRLCASASSPTQYPSTASYDVIGVTPNTSSTAWSTHSFQWTAPNNASYITVNPENDVTINVSTQVSWGQVDDICIVEVVPCPGTIVDNGDFSAGLVAGSMPTATAADWSRLTESPQVMTSAGCGDAGCIQMWGNQVVGESIFQQLPGSGIRAGRTYEVSLCYRWVNNNPAQPPHVRFRLSAATAFPGAYPPLSTYTPIGSTPNTSSTSWLPHSFQWTAPVDAQWIVINPENNSSINLGTEVSWGQIDDICIRELPRCSNGLVANSGFGNGLVPGSMPTGSVDDWSPLHVTPQVVTPDGCNGPGCIQMWGNQVVGESIVQQLPGTGILAGRTYRVSVCYRWHNTSAIQPTYVRFRLSASASAPGMYPPLASYDLIGVTPNTSSTAWLSHTFQWTAPNNASYLIINPENDLSVNNGDFVSWGQIDDICIQDMSVQAESTSYGVGCFDLALSANGPPTLGSTIQLVTTNVPSGTSLGFTLLSFTKFDPGIDLSSNGMPGCWQFVGLDVVTTFLPSGSVGVVPFQLPNSITFGGAEVRSQSATLSPATTPLGVITSNGIELVLGTY